MSFLLDTNVISEWTKPRPHAGVVEWLASVDEDETFISVISLAEIRYGIERLPSSARQRRLEDWFVKDLPHRFDGRIISVDTEIAGLWGQIAAERDRVGRRMDPLDGFIAATARIHGMKVVTRNVSDFDGFQIGLIDPWKAQGS